jgi:spore germination cell wall hydrolase CwlJ-like protein
MTSLSCLALLIYMEASTQGSFTQSLVADVAIARAEKEKLSICASMRKPKSYSWMWDGKHTKVDTKKLKQLEKIALQELKRVKIRTRTYFNTCSLGKRYKTKNKMIRSEKLCFY